MRLATGEMLRCGASPCRPSTANAFGLALTNVTIGPWDLMLAKDKDVLCSPDRLGSQESSKIFPKRPKEIPAPLGNSIGHVPRKLVCGKGRAGGAGTAVGVPLKII